MQRGWEGKMRAALCLLLLAACVCADDSEDRHSKLPYVADAVGNTLPPPSNLPATVGSPVNLLTPDRYEFYTFDESGELVKRLMTLEEIQAIVAAGEETEGLVTFANDNQPTIAFNFSQPPYTKVHSVVTNVQNVLKAQMEAHKNKPLTQPTLDTPDVSDSWSLILPSIFGNTGVDIVPDKTSGGFTTPETETIEIDRPVNDNLLSKEGNTHITSSSSTAINELKEISITEKISTTEEVRTNPITTTSTTSTTTTTTTTQKPTIVTTTAPKSTQKQPITTITAKPWSSTSATKQTSTTKPTSKLSTTARPRTTTTNQPRSTTTIKPRITTSIKPTTKANIRTTAKPTAITKKQVLTTQKNNEQNYTRVQVQTLSNTIPTTEKSSIHYEKISTFIPISTATYITERTTVKSVPVQTTRTTVASTTKRAVSSTTKSPSSSASVKIPPTVSTTRKPFVSTVGYVSSTPKTDNFEKLNVTTITTQSIFPPTTVSSTEHISLAHLEDKSTTEKNNNESDPPIFDVAQSISQIASDLGNYRPNPTTSDLLDTTRFTEMNLESKENIEIDIPTDSEKDTDIKTSSTTEKNTDNFVKISTLEPHQTDQRVTDVKEIPKTDNIISSSTTEKMVLSTSESITTTIDPVLSESMDDLLSQIVNEAPQNIMETETSTAIVYKETSETTKEKLQITTKTPENKTEKNEITTKVPLKLVEESTKISEQKPDQKNVTTNILDNNIPAVDTRKKEEITINKDHASLKEEDKSEPNKKEQQNYNKVSLAPSKNNEKVKPTTTISNNEKIVEETKGNESDIKTIKKDIPEKETKKPNNVSSQDKDAKTTTTTQSPKLVSATEETLIASKKPDNVLSQPAINKVGSIINEKEKNVAAELIPKIDEFKKKIQKVNIDDKELANERNNSWKLISTVSPPKANEIPKDRLKTDSQDNANDKDILLEFSKENQGLEVTTKNLGEDIAQFTELCNELAFRYWHTMIETIDKKRSFVLSPYSITSMLAMMFMGARGATSGEMNEILKLDDMVTFNPHFTLKNISDSIETTSESGIIVSAFIRELFSDRSRGKILTFYKERAQHFYNGHVEEVNFKLISDIIRRRTNLLVKRYTWGRIVEYMKSNSIIMQPPLAAFSANIFQTDCSGSTVEGRDGEMYFVVSPNVRQRRLVPVPAVVYRTGFLAGYDPALDATAAALGNSNSIISTLFVMPGQQGNIVHADDLEALEKRLLDSNPTTPAWNRLLRTLLPRIGLELQIPRFSHKSIFNISSTLKQMGLKDLFDADHADLGGLNGPSKDLHLSDMIQMTTFVTCGEGIIGEQHHIEEYPENLEERQKRRTSRWINDWDEPRDYQRAFHDPHDVGEAMRLPLHLRPRQARLPARNAQPARLKFDRPFLYFVRHNPSGMILYVGRYNPRLLP